ncbi:protein SMIM45 isoform X2 [Tympanuchus pallidicinctus]|uniref:protein SMIM45 isoform X2 n=1 Tax=Tympanuchus pallidicinctus TaxID=109042 RepID=UPI00228732AA|nr:protein SMIM45 isoform X2 [Tympanuchus pallidicinctus]
MDAIVPPPGLGGGGREGRGGLWVSPELPAGGGCCCPRLSLPPRAPLRTGPGRGSAESGPVHPGGSGSIPPPVAEGGAMPHFLDWFVPVYLMISILILVGFGACIYYFEPGLQEAHKWRTQRPIMERDLRKTLMIRDNLAFGVPEV